MSESKCKNCETILSVEEENICTQCEFELNCGRRKSSRTVLATGLEYEDIKEPLIEIHSDDLTLGFVENHSIFSQDKKERKPRKNEPRKLTKSKERIVTKKKQRNGLKSKQKGIKRWHFCDACPKCFVNEEDLVEHKLCHDVDEKSIPLPFKCTECDRSFATECRLKPHIATHTANKPFKCAKCPVRFKHSSTLARHVNRLHSKNKPWKCTLCDFDGGKKSKLTEHMHKYHNTIVCLECGKSFTKKSRLTNHMRKHTGERPFACTVCDYRAPQSGQLKRHMQVHTGEKPYECDVCGKRVSAKHSLKAHKFIHTGEKPLVCTLCGKRFRRPAGLKVHMMYHNKDMRHFCTQCGFGSPYPYKLKIHIKTVHSNETPYECDVCGKKYKEQSNLNKHKRGIRGSCPGGPGGQNGPVNYSKHPTPRKSTQKKTEPALIPISNQGVQDANRFNFMSFSEQSHVNSNLKQYSQSQQPAPNMNSNLKQFSEHVVHNKPKDNMSHHSQYQEPTLPTLPMQSITAAAIQSYQHSSQNLLDVGITNNQAQYQGFFTHPNTLNYASNL